LTYLPFQKMLEIFANENHEMPDRRIEGTKPGNSSTFVIFPYDN